MLEMSLSHQQASSMGAMANHCIAWLGRVISWIGIVAYEIPAMLAVRGGADTCGTQRIAYVTPKGRMIPRDASVQQSNHMGDSSGWLCNTKRVGFRCIDILVVIWDESFCVSMP